MQTDNTQLQDSPLEEQEAEALPTQIAETDAASTEADVAPAEETGAPALPRKPFYKTLLFWELTVGGLVFLCVMCALLIILRNPGWSIASPNSTTSQTTTQETTEETLPPPEANPIGLGDFYMDGDYLSCLSTPSVLGIDVSVWQGDIDWEQVKAAGVEFAMIRAGWRGSEQGVLAEDTYAQINYSGAAAAGVQVGAYFFSQAISVEEATEEANYLLSIIKDWNVEMPVVFDWEYIDDTSRTGSVDARTLTDCTKAFCDTVAKAGYQPMVYFNTNHSYENVYIRELTQYPFWLARYDTVLDYPYKIDMWQYSETGSVPGIAGNVDINLYFPWEEKTADSF